MTHPYATRCGICDADVEIPERARALQFCSPCDIIYQQSPERAEAVSARERFAARRRKEIGK